VLSDDDGDEVSVRSARGLAAHKFPAASGCRPCAISLQALLAGLHQAPHPLWRLCCPPAAALRMLAQERPGAPSWSAVCALDSTKPDPQTDTPVHLLQVWWGASVLEPREADGTWRIQYDEREGFDAEDAHVDFLTKCAPWALVMLLVESACQLMPLYQLDTAAQWALQEILLMCDIGKPAQCLGTRLILLCRGRPC